MDRNRDFTFHFGPAASWVRLQDTMPSIDHIIVDLDAPFPQNRVLLICDSHTEALAESLLQGRTLPRCVLSPGEEAKGWAQVERILAAASAAGLGRDGLFLALGGGVVSDLCAFAASVFMRGCQLRLIATSLLGMVDAALGGKTGFDLLGIKNLVGSFYPAERIYMPLAALDSLPPVEWKSGMAELIKTALLGDRGLTEKLRSLAGDFRRGGRELLRQRPEAVFDLIAAAVAIKGRIVEADPRETGTDRVLLNLGHTFAHALEAAVGLGRISHGEAVAWGLARSSELGLRLCLTPRERAREISALLRSYGYETAAPHPLMGDPALFMEALGGDKKKRGGRMRLVVPTARSAQVVEAGPEEVGLLRALIQGKGAL